MFIISIKKVGLQFPRHDTAIALKDHVFGEVYKAINTLDCIVKNINSSPDKRSSINSTQTAATSLKKLEVNPPVTLISLLTAQRQSKWHFIFKEILHKMTPDQFREKKSRLALQRQIDETIKHITKSIIVHSSSKLMSKCTDLSDAFLDLFSSYEKNMNLPNRMSPENFNKSKNDFIRRTNSIRRLVGD